MDHPTITRHDTDGHTRAVILMLHGGKQRSSQPVDWRSTSWHRAHAMQRTIAPAAQEQDVGTWLLRYRQRGWNASGGPSPLPDATWALDQIRGELGEVPVVLVGHSMGARTAVHVANHPQVVGVVALAPWLTADDPVHSLTDIAFAAAHGSRDRITSPRATADFVRRAQDIASSVELHDMGPVGHYMFKQVPQWNDFALDRSLKFLSTY